MHLQCQVRIFRKIYSENKLVDLFFLSRILGIFVFLSSKHHTWLNSWVNRNFSIWVFSIWFLIFFIFIVIIWFTTLISTSSQHHNTLPTECLLPSLQSFYHTTLLFPGKLSFIDVVSLCRMRHYTPPSLICPYSSITVNVSSNLASYIFYYLVIVLLFFCYQFVIINYYFFFFLLFWLSEWVFSCSHFIHVLMNWAEKNHWSWHSFFFLSLNLILSKGIRQYERHTFSYLSTSVAPVRTILACFC